MVSTLLGMMSIYGKMNGYIMVVYSVIKKMNLKDIWVQKNIFELLW